MSVKTLTQSHSYVITEYSIGDFDDTDVYKLQFNKRYFHTTGVIIRFVDLFTRFFDMFKNNQITNQRNFNALLFNRYKTKCNKNTFEKKNVIS